MKLDHIATWLSQVALLAASACSGESRAPDARFQIQTAPLQLTGIDEAIYTVTVENALGDTVWQQVLGSNQYGDGEGSITYVGPCDASANANPNTITVSLDQLVDDDGVTLTDDDWVRPPAVSKDVDCVENADTLIVFNITVVRSANQGFFDIAVNFEDVFCSAKYDTCYDVGGPDERPINLLHGPDGARDHTGVMALACAGNPETTDRTVLHRSIIWVWCNDWNVFWQLDPSLGPGNVEITAIDRLDRAATCALACESTHPETVDWLKYFDFQIAPVEDGSMHSAGTDASEYDFAAAHAYCASLGDCSGWEALDYRSFAQCELDLLTCADVVELEQCLTGCPITLRYATYWGTEALDCGSGPGSCNKVYWNVAIDLQHLADRGLSGCNMVTIATASTESSDVIANGEIATSDTWYPVIDHGDFTGDLDTGLPLVAGLGEAIPCVAEQLNAEGSLVHTDYAESDSFNFDPLVELAGEAAYWDRLCFSMTQDASAPVGDPECLAWWCEQMERTATAESQLPAFCQ